MLLQGIEGLEENMIPFIFQFSPAQGQSFCYPFDSSVKFIFRFVFIISLN